jgi:hypothetical protein
MALPNFTMLLEAGLSHFSSGVDTVNSLLAKYQGTQTYPTSKMKEMQTGD